ncbi:TPA: LOW QUALITY PROTEIN: hypothetical protein N0F65_005032 [Lagenidium giganteum]|uniref:Poly [ADP-ribose] polymerase n=1 Tax=Lagenidium giganteum TaxID=4803 RepID=A0AAV2ZF14_9STRA|nr:TPA: LOW QUALITY PROTEIN: hypothetical protein N0F65_005032 [Lagenidium giganteum]
MENQWRQIAIPNKQHSNNQQQRDNTDDDNVQHGKTTQHDPPHHTKMTALARQAKRKWEEVDWEVVMAAQSFVAVYAASGDAEESKAGSDDNNKMRKTTKTGGRGKQRKEVKKEATGDLAAPVDEFWLAQLPDDVTEDVIEGDSGVLVTWFNKKGNAYQYAYDDRIDIDLSLRRAKGEAIAEEDEDDERPLSAGCMRKTASKRGATDDNIGDPGDRRSVRRSRGRVGGEDPSTPKLTKRQLAMRVPPRYTMVDVDKYTERELTGTQDFELITDDVVSNNREVLRAVLTKNYKLLKKLARAIDAKNMAKTPDISLPSHSTGSHTSSYSDYNRRAINASRGGKEGNNALLNDTNGATTQYEDESFFWSCSDASVKMMTVLYPTGHWASSNLTYHVRNVAASGNYRLCFKLIETLNRNGGWGYNDLHCKVLSPDDEALPQFRNVSATKQAYQTKIHPNVKYLMAMWNAAGDEFSGIKDDNGFEPVHYAAACEGLEPLKFLLGQNLVCAQQEATNADHVTKREDNAIYVLDYASQQGQEVVGKVVAERGPGSFQALYYAALRGCPRVIEKLLSFGADINSVCRDKMTALCVAAREGHYDCVKLLLEHGAKVDMGNKLKKAPLMLAVKNGHTRIAALLVNIGANVNAYDTSDNTVVHYAAASGWRSCLELLADTGADFWVRNSWGFVPLICALLKQRLVSSMFILERDTKQQFLDFRDRQGCTMLFLQCKHSMNLSQIEYLLEKGLSPNVSNSEGEFPLQTMITRSANYVGEDTTFFRDAVKLLLKYGANAELSLVQRKEDSAHPTILQPLQLAIVNKQKEVFTLLLDKFRANPNAKSSIGTDAWLSAMSMGREALLDHCKTSIDLSATTLCQKNILHLVADCGVAKLMDPVLVRQCVNLYSSSRSLINEKDSSGYTPLMLLLSKERNGHSEDPRTPAFAEKLEEAKLIDKDFYDVVDLFAELTAGPDSLVFSIARKKTASDEMVAVDHGSAACRGKGDSRFGAKDDQERLSGQTKYELVEWKTLLHWAAQRRLTKGNSDRLLQWYGRSLISILLRWTSSRLLLVMQWKPKTQQRFVGFSRKVQILTIRPCCARCASRNACGALPACIRTRINSPLCTAVQNLDTRVVKELLKHGAHVDVCTSAKDTPLHLAMRADHGKITTMLLERNADLTFTNLARSSPIHAAIAANKTIPRKQVHEGEVAYTDITRTKPAKSGPPALVIALKNTKSQESGDTRRWSPANTHPPCGSQTRSDIASSTYVKTAVNMADEVGRTPLHFAVSAAKMNPDASFQSGANANAVDKFNFTVLHLALFKVDFDWHRSYDLRKDAVEAKADREVKTYDKKKAEAFREEPAIIPSTETDPVETISNLAAVRGINVTVCDELGRTPLHLAGATGAFVCTATLLNVFASESARCKALEMKDREELTPLAHAVRHLRQPTIMTLAQADTCVSVHVQVAKERMKHRLTGICHVLLNAKFPRRQAMEMISSEVTNNPELLTRTSNDADTLLHALSKVNKSFDDLAQLFAWSLIEGGVPAAHQNAKENTALHYAAKNANTPLTDFLLHNKCDVHQCNSNGETPLLYAIKRSNADLKDIIGVIDYFFSNPQFNVHAMDHSGMNVLTAFLDRYAGDIDTETTYFVWMEEFLQRGVDANGLFTSMSKVDLFENTMLSSSTTTKVTALIRASYMPSTAGRANMIGMLLRYGAKVTTVDEGGHSLLTHLKHVVFECKLVLGKVCRIRDPTDRGARATHGHSLRPSVMPCNEDAFGSSIRGFDRIGDVNKEITRLRTLIDITETYKILLGAKFHQRNVNPIEYCHDSMQVNFSTVGSETDEGKLLTQYFLNGLAPHERSCYRVSNVFAVNRKGEHKRFLDFLDENPSFKRKHSALLWHGTRRTNVMGILTQGLRIAPPEALHQGLYFANVSAKRLSYCDAPYSITWEAPGEDEKKQKQTRNVRYLLLCEVALGDSKGADSVKCAGKIFPNDRLALVSPECGAKLEVGKVGEEGVDHPMPMVWAMKVEEKRKHWNERLALRYGAQINLNKVVRTMAAGDTLTIDKVQDVRLFVNHYAEKRVIKIEVDAETPGDQDDHLPQCEVTVKIHIIASDTSSTLHSVSAKRYRNIFVNHADKVLPEGYFPKLDYDEFIVYNESQARIRYLVEIEDKN